MDIKRMTPEAWSGVMSLFADREVGMAALLSGLELREAVRTGARLRDDLSLFSARDMDTAGAVWLGRIVSMLHEMHDPVSPVLFSTGTLVDCWRDDADDDPDDPLYLFDLSVARRSGTVTDRIMLFPDDALVVHTPFGSAPALSAGAL